MSWSIAGTEAAVEDISIAQPDPAVFKTDSVLVAVPTNMTSLPFVFHPVSSSSEIASLASVEAAAMLPQPFNTCYFRATMSTEQQLSFFQHALERKWRVRHATRTRFLKAVSTHTGQVEGFVLWSLKQPAADTTVSNVVETMSDDEVEVLVEGKNDDHDLLSPGADAWAEGAYALHREITKRFDDAESSWIYLDKMYVRPRSQRQGLATALWCEGPLKEAEARLLSNQGRSDGVNLPLPILTVSVGSSRMFYESVGFQSVDRSVIRFDEVVGEGSGFGEFWFTGLVREVTSDE